MAIENERKFVLDVAKPQAFMNVLEHISGASKYTYRQGYLNDNTRIRGITANGVELPPVFTYKDMINKKLIEVETTMDQTDFVQLWTKVTRVINKVRVKVPVGDLVWEVDFFMDTPTQEIFLVMAEVELPDGVDMPDFIPAFISKNLLHLVERHDERFINSKMAQPIAVRKTIEALKHGKLHAA